MQIELPDTAEYHENLMQTELTIAGWQERLSAFLLTPSGARFLLRYFQKPLHEFTQSELNEMQREWEQRAISDFPPHLRARIG